MGVRGAVLLPRSLDKGCAHKLCARYTTLKADCPRVLLRSATLANVFGGKSRISRALAARVLVPLSQVRRDGSTPAVLPGTRAQENVCGTTAGMCLRG